MIPEPEPSPSDRYAGKVIVGIYLFLVLLFSLMQIVAAYSQSHSDIRGQSGAGVPVESLDIGDSIPKSLWSLHHHVVDRSGGSKSVALETYKDTLVILDFWASWCVPCLTSLAKLDSLQGIFPQELAVIPVTYEPGDKATALFREKGLNLITVTDDKVLKTYFPHRFVPHQVWIKEGKVIAVTSSSESSAANIAALLQSGTLEVKEKKDILNYAATTPVSLYAMQKGAALLYNSSFTQYIGGLGTSETSVITDSTRVISFNNRRPLAMYKAALKIPHNQILVEATKGDSAKSIYSKKHFCYQLTIPAAVNEEQASKKILNDLNFIFQVRGRYEIRKRKCLIIKEAHGSRQQVPSDDQEESPAVKLGPFKFAQFVEQLNFSFNWEHDLPVIIDESGFQGEVTIGRPFKSLKTKDSLNQVLQTYNLIAVEGFTTQKVYVLTDPN